IGPDGGGQVLAGGRRAADDNDVVGEGDVFLQRLEVVVFRVSPHRVGEVEGRCPPRTRDRLRRRVVVVHLDDFLRRPRRIVFLFDAFPLGGRGRRLVLFLLANGFRWLRSRLGVGLFFFHALTFFRRGVLSGKIRHGDDTAEQE